MMRLHNSLHSSASRDFRRSNTCSRRRFGVRKAPAGRAHKPHVGPASTSSEPKTTLGVGVKLLSGGGGIFKSAAAAVLRMERRLMTTGEITKVALERGLINCQGRTPEATMASALYTDVKRKEHHSVFTRPQEGLFGLREWADEGFVPEAAEGWVPPAPAKRMRTSARMMNRSKRFDPRDDDELEDMLCSESEDSGHRSSGLQGRHSSEALSMLGNVCQSTASAQASQHGDRRRHQDTHDHELHEYLVAQRQRAPSLPLADGLATLHEAALSPSCMGPLMPHRTRHSPRLTLDLLSHEADDMDAALNNLQGGCGAHIFQALATPRSHASLYDVATPSLHSPQPEGRGAGFHSAGKSSLPLLQSPMPRFESLDATGLLEQLGEEVGGSGREDLELALRASALSGGLISPPQRAQLSMPYHHYSGRQRGHEALLLSSPERGFRQPAQRSPPRRQPAQFGAQAEPSDGQGSQQQPPEGHQQRVQQQCSQTAACEGAWQYQTRPLQLQPSEQPHEHATGNPEAQQRPVQAPRTDSQERLPAATVTARATSATIEPVTAATPGPSTVDSLQQLAERVLRLEARLGGAHPHVGKAWLILSRTYSSQGSPDFVQKAQRALARAWEVCSACTTLTKSQADFSDAQEPFTYLMERINALAPAPTQQQGS